MYILDFAVPACVHVYYSVRKGSHEYQHVVAVHCCLSDVEVFMFAFYTPTSHKHTHTHTPVRKFRGWGYIGLILSFCPGFVRTIHSESQAFGTKHGMIVHYTVIWGVARKVR